MSAADSAFRDAVDRIRSSDYISIFAAAGAWIALANSAGAESGALSGTARRAAGEPGVGLLRLADRLQATSSWAEGAATVAREIADQLQRAAERSARASEKAARLDVEFDEWRQWQLERNEQLPDGMGVRTANVEAEEQKERLAAEARRELEALGEEFARVIGGTAPPAPEGGAGPGATPVAAGGGGMAGVAGVAGGSFGPMTFHEAGGGVAGRAQVAPNGAVIGTEWHPSAHVLGPEGGDFAGWVRSPSTGFLVDPATGREFDPVAGRWIDPVTGEPFGEVTEYATRLSGLGAGPGAIATAGGLTGAATIAGLYGGAVPPSIGPTGPQQALRNLGLRSRAATRFALHEASLGGRPFTPPPGASAHGGA
ncbi:hypothetical protein EBN88_28870, partial [Streptomyces triticirhizae]